MPVVALCAAVFCRGREAAGELARRLGWPVLDDADLVAHAARLGLVDEPGLRGALFAPDRVWQKLRHDRELGLGPLRLALADLLAKDGLVYRGLGSHLIPPAVTHALQVCLGAPREYRLARATEVHGLDPDRARREMELGDGATRRWAQFLHGSGALPPTHYDILLPVDQRPWEECLALILDAVGGQPLAETPASRVAVADLALCGRVTMALADQGHYHPQIKTSVHQGVVELEINRKTLRLKSLRRKLERLAGAVAGVERVETKVGPGYHQSDVYRQSDFQLPNRVLLVDDEREFVETLSERLQLRQVGTRVVYDGEQALAAVAGEEPEVMVLDLRMPGVDGIEVLKRIKVSHPAVEVIVLTGHGSAADRQHCLDLGAFAYLQKPVDFARLSQVLAEAQKKRREGAGQP